MIYEDVMWDRIKNLAVAEVDSIYCSLLIYPARHSSTEGYHFLSCSFCLQLHEPESTYVILQMIDGNYQELCPF